MPSPISSPRSPLGLTLITLASLALPILSFKPAAALPAHNVPRAIEIASDLGRVDPATELNLTVVLQLHDSAEYDKAVEALYDPTSPTFHQWFTAKDFAKYAPSEADFETVRQELVSHGFTVVSSDPDRFSIRVHGTVSTAESAFQTEIHTFRYNGKTFTAHTREAQLTGTAGPLVASIAGLERHQAHSQLSVAKNFRTGKPLYKKPLSKTQDSEDGLGSIITNTPLTSPSLFTFSNSGALPIAAYFGNVYDINSSLIPDYTPQQLQSHYGLSNLIKEGYDGHGQTIALVEAFGYAAAEADANTAAQIFGLPALTSSNFSVIYPEGPPLNPADAYLTGWYSEIALDIQAAHSIAPGAKILVVASAGEDNEDLIASLQYIITKKLSSAVSSSWENDDEIISGPAEENAFNSVLKKGAAAGISFQFSSGDYGDLGLGSPIGSVAVPSNSPYATAVGGTSILNDPNGKGQIVAGWGNDIVTLAEGAPFDPPTATGYFFGGAGGGESVFYAKPWWQKSLPGTGRQVPDVSALADPNTGFPIIFTDSTGIQYIEAGVGGTSLASPLFTGIWAIADQYNGKALGFAAPAIAKLKAGEILDVVPNSSLVPFDAAGTVFDSSGASFYSATGLFAGLLYSQKQFPSAIFPVDPGFAIAISFGTDSSLTVTKGWDNVTGFGEPNGLPFIQGVSGKTKGSLGK